MRQTYFDIQPDRLVAALEASLSEELLAAGGSRLPPLSRNKATFSTKLSLRNCLVSSTETWRPTTTGLCIQACLEEDWHDLVPRLVRKL